MPCNSVSVPPEDAHFTLRTDNNALTWLYKVSDERGKLTRWTMYLVAFKFDVEYVTGRDNELPTLCQVSL